MSSIELLAFSRLIFCHTIDFCHFVLAMDFIQTKFSIQDLENLSGVKKHTIRIWEKRYGLLSPERTTTNIRFYSTSSLVHLLNVTLLYNSGFKISILAQFSTSQLASKCIDLIEEGTQRDKFVNSMKVAMLSFDRIKFDDVFLELRLKYSLSDIFQHYFMPLLKDIGLLWQTGTINPAHEHFIFSLIKQKILIETEKLGRPDDNNSSHRFVLFLPDNEVHDLGICFLNYEIARMGFHAVYLGQSVPMKSLEVFESPSDAKLVFISYFTIKPDENKIQDYLTQFQTDILDDSVSELWIIGYRTKVLEGEILPSSVKKFISIEELISSIPS